MDIPIELGVTNPVQTINAPPVPHQLQKSFWGGSQADVAADGASCHATQVFAPHAATGAAHIRKGVSKAALRGKGSDRQQGSAAPPI
jgi:hypothetical protein